MKRCTKCGKMKSGASFSKNITTKDGLAGWCKECSNIQHKKYRESPEGKAYKHKYNNSDKAIAARKNYIPTAATQENHKKYLSSEKGKAATKVSVTKYLSSDKGKAAVARYRTSDKGKAAIKRASHKQVLKNRLARRG